MDNPVMCYMQIVKDLETTVYIQNRIAQNLQRRDSQLGKEKDFSSFATTVAPSTEYKEKYQALYYKLGFIGFCLFFIFTLILTFLTGDSVSTGLAITIVIVFVIGGGLGQPSLL